MRKLICQCAFISFVLAGGFGCATQKESFTARTGVEQLLISSAIDQSLDKVNLAPVQSRKIFMETKYLDCVDKNYIIVSMHHRLLAMRAKLVDKADEADLVVELGSGGVGTDAEELFVGVPEIPLAPPSPIAIPKLGIFTRSKLNGTAKIMVIVYDAKTKAPVINNGCTLARSDQKTWHLVGAGSVQTGSVPNEIAKATGEVDFNVMSVAAATKNVIVGPSEPATPVTAVAPAAAAASVAPLAPTASMAPAAPAASVAPLAPIATATPVAAPAVPAWPTAAIAPTTPTAPAPTPAMLPVVAPNTPAPSSNEWQIIQPIGK
jgi:hypothetical protein